jgi:Recombinase
MVIDRIVVTERTLEEIHAVIRWKDGSPPTEIAMELSPYVHREIARLARAGWSNTAIARHLNERGMKTEKNRDWNVNSVGCQLRRPLRTIRFFTASCTTRPTVRRRVAW